MGPAVLARHLATIALNRRQTKEVLPISGVQCQTHTSLPKASKPTNPYMGVSENRGPSSSTKNSRIHIVRTPNNGPLMALISGNSHIGFGVQGLGPWTLLQSLPSSDILFLNLGTAVMFCQVPVFAYPS